MRTAMTLKVLRLAEDGHNQTAIPGILRIGARHINEALEAAGYPNLKAVTAAREQLQRDYEQNRTPAAERRPISETAIEDAMRGLLIHLTPTERTEAIQRLAKQGARNEEICGLLRISRRTVRRAKDLAGPPPVTPTGPLSPGRIRAKRREQAGIQPDSFVDAGPAIERIRVLRSYGMSVRSMAIVTRLPHQTIASLTWPTRGHPRTRLKRSTAERILAAKFTVDGLPDTAQVTTICSIRRIQALGRLGWTQTDIGKAAGMTQANIGFILQQQRHEVTTHKRIAAAYRHLSRSEGPSKRAKTMSGAKGWISPADWTNIDDPETKAEGRHRHNEVPVIIDTLANRRKNIWRMHKDGKTRSEIVAVVRCAPRTVDRVLGREEAA